MNYMVVCLKNMYLVEFNLNIRSEKVITRDEAQERLAHLINTSSNMKLEELMNDYFGWDENCNYLIGETQVDIESEGDLT